MEAMNIYDVVVIGGGINGTGIANDAAGRGLKVLLCEKNDLASSTSSNSSKLIHGGLRYLEHYQFRLVKEALAEREILLKNAPHIIWPLRFILPHQSHLRPRWMILAGLFLYDNLSKLSTLKKSHGVTFKTDSPLVSDIKKGFEYSDAWVDDSRLVSLNAMSAKNNGGTICTQHACVKALRENDHWLITLNDNLNQNDSTIKCKVLVNAAGPWVADLFTSVINVTAPQNVRLIKGSHIVVPKIHDGEKAYVLQNEDQRIVFVIPYEGDFTLIGTTDIEVKQDPSTVKISDDEIDYLIGVTNKNFTHKINRSDIVHTFSGVRPLLDDESTSAQAITRDYTLDINNQNDAPPLLSVFGGKITTYRKLAEAAVDKIAPFFKEIGPSWTKHNPLPGGDFSSHDNLSKELAKRYPWLDIAIRHRYIRSYGTLSNQILSSHRSIEDMGKHFGAGLYECEVQYLINFEWAYSPEDILWRRSKLGLRLTSAEQSKLAYFMRSIITRNCATSKKGQVTL
ncbi:MAG: glycerol-3-phosphate dehydrogenase [Candidatus Endobugula sp.]|jgi:glycerol-3-phosphate dehydrogenase